jgi:hypothetical protein
MCGETMNPAYIVDGITYEYSSFMRIDIGDFRIDAITYGCHGIKYGNMWLSKCIEKPKYCLNNTKYPITTWTSNIYDALRWHGGDVERAINLAERLRDVYH